MYEDGGPFRPGTYVYVGFVDTGMVGVLGTIIEMGSVGVVVQLDRNVKLQRIEGIAFYPWSNVVQVSTCPRPEETR